MLERLWTVRTILAGAAALAVVAVGATAVHAQKIICWKDAAGKVIGCGDRVPPEFQKNETKRIDSQGITRGTSVSAEEATRLKEEAKKKSELKADEERRLAEQKRQDDALINTYTTVKEIDQRGERELQVVDAQLGQMKNSLKSATEAHANLQKRHDDIAKSGKPVPDRVGEDLKQATEAKGRAESRVADKEKEKAEIIARYAQQKARFVELRGGASATAPAAAAAAPAKK